MSEADVAAMSRIPLEVFNKGDLSVIDIVVVDVFIEHSEMPPGSQLGPSSVQYGRHSRTFNTWLKTRSALVTRSCYG
jgi:hypothetical protein